MPDLPTRRFVQILHKSAKHIYFLNDYDPWGMAISKTYAFPKANAWHQQSRHLKNCSLLALSLQDGASYGLRHGDMLKMTNRDKTRCTNFQNELAQISRQQRVKSGSSSDAKGVANNADRSEGSEQVDGKSNQHEMIKAMEECISEMLRSGKKYELDAIPLLEQFLLEKLSYKTS